MQMPPENNQQSKDESKHSANGSAEEEAALGHIGDRAVQLGAIVDIVATAGNPAYAKQLLQLTQRTGGTVICSSRLQFDS